MGELASFEKREKEYSEKKKVNKNDFFDDYSNENLIQVKELVEKRNKEAEESEKRKQEKIKKLKDLAKKGTFYIKGGLK